MSGDMSILKKASFVTSSQIRTGIILFLHSREYATPKEISKRLGKHLSTVSRALAELKNEGLVEFVEHEHSKSRLYFLTEAGKDVAALVKNISGDFK